MQIFAEEVTEVDFEDFGSKRNDEFGDEVNGSSCCSSRSSSSSSSPCHFSPWMLDGSLSSRTFSYELLAVEPIRLIVQKLDGSSFDIIVTKKATVGDLKKAVEDEFSQLSEQVSWSHLWAQFCLCFKDQKLLDDQESIERYGIQDDDQLRFIRHTSIGYNLGRQRSEKQDSEYGEPHKSSSKSFTYDGTQKNGGNKKKGGVAIKYRSRWFHVVRWYFSYHNLDCPDVHYRALTTSSRSNSTCGSPDVFEDMKITSYHDKL
ncbi:uncharacterized protein LOC112520272 isoform X2 [Cynara cardunculus var. scolymus]|uniref:uncharacterized protein LOC112520272 isoform X2 n=1 Tax=Cynara cardunculus var. scolymus TaxID=59895 RepID=UPI000D62AE32|nr:uncharacterized protein LOC112520272 isoform X2 [Cynara cardunculus var. scolymus]